MQVVSQTCACITCCCGFSAGSCRPGISANTGGVADSASTRPAVSAPPRGLALSGTVPRERERQRPGLLLHRLLLLFPSIVIIVTTKRQSPAWGQQRELL